MGLGFAPILLWLGAGCQSVTSDQEERVGSSQEKIVGGSVAPAGSYPWMARLSSRVVPSDGSPSYFAFACGGSLIAADWVLTAAHCVAVIENKVLKKTANADMQVVIGERNLNNPDGTEQVRSVDNIIVNPGYVYVEEEGYGQVKEFNDIALVHLTSPVTLNDSARIIKLASENDDPGKETWLSGWGADVYGQGKISSPPVPQLKQMSATIVDPTNASDPDGGCSNRLLLERAAGIGAQRAIDKKTEICNLNFMSGVDSYQSACYWDSGSPWVVYNSGCPEQVMVHTFGDYNCVSYNAGTRVSAYLPWIREQGVPYVGDRVYEAETMFHATGNAYADGWNVYDNNYISFHHVFGGGQQQLTVRAAGQNGNGWPRMRVSVGGTTVYETDVTSASWANYTFTFNAPVGDREVQIRFLNDYIQGSVDRNLLIDKAKVKDARTSCGTTTAALTPTLRITNDWGAGYCAEIDIKNNAAQPTTSWTVVYDTKTSTVYDSWNPTVAKTPNQHTAVPVESWLKVIQPNTTKTLGFCANRAPGNTTSLPEVVSATAMY